MQEKENRQTSIINNFLHLVVATFDCKRKIKEWEVKNV